MPATSEAGERTHAQHGGNSGVGGLGGLASGIAHVDAHPAESAWWAWRFTPDIVIGMIIVAALYAAGLHRLKGRGASPSAWRNASFIGWLSLIFLALQSPLDASSTEPTTIWADFGVSPHSPTNSSAGS